MTKSLTCNVYLHLLSFTKREFGITNLIDMLQLTSSTWQSD